ncbi:MAG: glycosyltransferase family 2 protein [Nitrospirae bacterium]|nr:glycosyltransferase family 2 protein [Nitrospirota bacterium]
MEQFIIIIPAFNEEGRIGKTVPGIRSLTDMEIVVVCDGCGDATLSEARLSGATVIELPFNLGYGAALQTGYQYAIGKGYAYALQMDADGQHDPAYIPVLLERVQAGDVDVAIGSRFLGESDYRPTTIKKIGMIFFSAIASFLTGKEITDPTSGFQALNRKAMGLYASEAYPVDFPDADVLIMLHRQGLRFVEVPVKMNPNTKKKTMHSGLVPVYYLFKMMLSIVVTLLRKNEFRRES